MSERRNRFLYKEKQPFKGWEKKTKRKAFRFHKLKVSSQTQFTFATGESIEKNNSQKRKTFEWESNKELIFSKIRNVTKLKFVQQVLMDFWFAAEFINLNGSFPPLCQKMAAEH